MVYTEKVYCKTCNNRMTAKEVFLNTYRICKNCLDHGISKESKKRTLDKYQK